MIDAQMMHWVSVVIIAPAADFLLRAAGRIARRQLNWGIGGRGAPISRLGDLSWSLVFLSAALAALFTPPPLARPVLALVVASVVMLVCTAVSDSVRHHNLRKSAV